MMDHNLPIYDVSSLVTVEIPAAKVSVEELERLHERAIEHRDEAPYFRALLDATLYAHAPLSDDSGRVRFIQFPHPDTRKDTLPFFTDVEQARQAAQGHVKVLAMSGRLFFELSLGAMLVLNPNRDAVMLYPEEIRELLRTSEIAEAGMGGPQNLTGMTFRPSRHAPDWIAEWLKISLPQLPYVEKAHLVDARRAEPSADVTLMILLAVAPAYFERAARAMATLIQQRTQQIRISIDVLPYDPKSEMGQWVCNLGEEAVYERSRDGGPLADSLLEQMFEEHRDPKWLARFHAQLLRSEVLVPVNSQRKGAPRAIIPAGSDLDVITLSRSDGVRIVPFFSSSGRLYQWSSTGEECAVLTVRELFESLPNMYFFLNPQSQEGREFAPSLVSALLKGEAS